MKFSFWLYSRLLDTILFLFSLCFSIFSSRRIESHRITWFVLHSMQARTKNKLKYDIINRIHQKIRYGIGIIIVVFWFGHIWLYHVHFKSLSHWNCSKKIEKPKFEFGHCHNSFFGRKKNQNFELWSEKLKNFGFYHHRRYSKNQRAFCVPRTAYRQRKCFVFFSFFFNFDRF